MPVRKSGQTSILQGKVSSPRPCILTWYDPALGGTNSGNGQPDAHAATASGEPYNPNTFTCAAPLAYPFGTLITFLYGGSQVTCKVNDRGGAITGAHFDLSRGAAAMLGIITAGKVNARFIVAGNAGTPSIPTDAAASTQDQPSDSGFTLSFGGLFSLAASDVAQFLFDALIKFPAVLIGDYLVLPAWHWNQRAAAYFTQVEMSDDSGIAQMALLAFWSLGYVLLWGDADGNSALSTMRAPERSRLARHIRTAQQIPARRQLLKPNQVKQATLKKPKPRLSGVPVRELGRMSTTRPQRVTVYGYRSGNGDNGRNETNGDSEREGTQRDTKATRGKEGPGVKTENSASGKPDSHNRTRSTPYESVRGDSAGGSREDRIGRRRVSRR